MRTKKKESDGQELSIFWWGTWCAVVVQNNMPFSLVFQVSLFSKSQPKTDRFAAGSRMCLTNYMILTDGFHEVLQVFFSIGGLPCSNPWMSRIFFWCSIPGGPDEGDQAYIGKYMRNCEPFLSIQSVYSQKNQTFHIV